MKQTIKFSIWLMVFALVGILPSEKVWAQSQPHSFIVSVRKISSCCALERLHAESEYLSLSGHQWESKERCNYVRNEILKKDINCNRCFTINVSQCMPLFSSDELGTKSSTAIKGLDQGASVYSGSDADKTRDWIEQKELHDKILNSGVPSTENDAYNSTIIRVLQDYIIDRQISYDYRNIWELCMNKNLDDNNLCNCLREHFLFYNPQVFLPERGMPLLWSQDNEEARDSFDQYIDKLIEYGKKNDLNVYDKAALSSSIYHLDDKNYLPKEGGWASVDNNQIDDPSLLKLLEEFNVDGFYAKIYHNKNTGEYVLSYRGTDDIADVIVDVNQAAGNEDFINQYEKAINLAKSFAAIYGEKGTLSIVGHSLGGALASIAGVATKLKTYTFNAAGVHKNTLKKYGLENEPTSNILAYHSQDDILTKIQNAKDQKEELKSTAINFLSEKTGEAAATILVENLSFPPIVMTGVNAVGVIDYTLANIGFTGTTNDFFARFNPSTINLLMSLLFNKNVLPQALGTPVNVGSAGTHSIDDMVWHFSNYQSLGKLGSCKYN